MQGICKISTMACRAEPSDRSELVNQLLYGERYEVLESHERWLRIENALDAYQAWVPKEQFHDFQMDTSTVSVLTRAARILGPGKPSSWILLSPGSRLTKEEFQSVESTDQPDDANAAVPLSKNGILSLAFSFLNTPYLWGGRSLWGIDCSGFAQVLFLCAGISLPRDAHEQALIGDNIPFGHKRPLDLAFFSNQEGRIVHVGLILEGNAIIHASGKVRIDSLSEEGIIHSESGNRTHTLNHLTRLAL